MYMPRKKGHRQPKNAMADTPLSSSRKICVAAEASYVGSEVNYRIFRTIQVYKC